MSPSEIVPVCLDTRFHEKVQVPIFYCTTATEFILYFWDGLKKALEKDLG